jgi:pseudaminic acid synthase
MSKNTFIIAEIANAHGGSLDNCLEVLRAAKFAGADAFKVATYKASHLTIKCDREEFKLNNSDWSDFSDLWSLYEQIHMPWEFHEPIFKLGREIEIEVFSSPFSIEAVKFLKDEFNPNYYKVASMEAIHYPLIEYIAKTDKKVLFSTGKSLSLTEISRVVDILKRFNNQKPVIFHCTSEYPAPISQANLNTILELIKVFGSSADIGLSDHSNGILVPMLAVALGATFIEKHITLNKDKYFPNGMRNPDVEFSITPDFFEAMCKGIRLVEHVKNNNCEDLSPLEMVLKVLRQNKDLNSFVNPYEIQNAKHAFGYYVPKGVHNQISGGLRRSLIFTADVKKGDVLKFGINFDILRPGHGLHPEFLNDVNGSTITLSAYKGEGVSFKHVE